MVKKKPAQSPTPKEINAEHYEAAKHPFEGGLQITHPDGRVFDAEELIALLAEEAAAEATPEPVDMGVATGENFDEDAFNLFMNKG